MGKVKEKGDENFAGRAVLSARRPITYACGSGKRRVCLVVARGNRTVRFVCASGFVRTAPSDLSVRRSRARVVNCHGVVLVVGSVDLRAGPGSPAACRPRPRWGIGDLP